jgi:hypothetical protein
MASAAGEWDNVHMHPPAAVHSPGSPGIPFGHSSPGYTQLNNTVLNTPLRAVAPRANQLQESPLARKNSPHPQFVHVPLDTFQPGYVGQKNKLPGARNRNRKPTLALVPRVPPTPAGVFGNVPKEVMWEIISRLNLPAFMHLQEVSSYIKVSDSFQCV